MLRAAPTAQAASPPPSCAHSGIAPCTPLVGSGRSGSKVQSSATTTSSNAWSELPVARMPVTCHESSDRARSIGKKPARISMPPSATSGCPSFVTIADAITHEAWADPDRYVAVPLKLKPPSTRSARAVTGFKEPHMSPAGSPQISVSAAFERKRANSGPSARIASTHPVDASHEATRSNTRTDSGMVRSSPPSSAGTSILNSSASCSASMTAGVRRPSRSDSAAPSRTTSAIASTRSSRSSTAPPDTA